jgi:ribosomal-protein-alanine N-acetyltransferase
VNGFAIVSGRAGRRDAPAAPARSVLLRPPGPDDEVEFLAFVRASRRLHRPWVTPPDDAAGFRAYLDRLAGDQHRGFLVCRRGDEAIVGVINVNNIVRGAWRSASLGYYAHAGFAGQGHMSQGLALVLRHAFGELALHRIEANIVPENEASRRLVRQQGFRREGYSSRFLKVGGRWRDHERWALTVEDWRAALRRAGTAPLSGAAPRRR